MFPLEHQAYPSAWGQKALIVGAVLILHSVGILALHHGTQKTVQPQIITAEVIAQFIAPTASEPPAPAPSAPQPPPEAPKPIPKPKPEPAKPKPAPQIPALPKAIADPTPAPNAPSGVLDNTPTETADAPAPAPVAVASTTPAASRPSGGAVELPSSSASYLNNPKPSYPSISQRMQEEGQVLLRVLVSAAGLPEKIEIKQSSGFDRLDQAAIKSVQRWKFSPGKRDGVPEAMWNIVPINFVLE